ncbi:hypothetical protein HK104_010274 [Borealophlyctis nickersoniae]|nr:hypothetical protein HK104_010274 [Borealophlyctis nickersoniae]
MRKVAARSNAAALEARKTFQVGTEWEDAKGDVVVPRLCEGRRGGELYWYVSQMNGRKVGHDKVCGMAKDGKFTIVSWRIFEEDEEAE